MKIDINEIARRAGVSIATVSRALSGKGPVKEETRQKILEIAREFNYKPNPIARGLSRKTTDTIGVILPELVDEFFMDIIHGIDEEAYRANRYVMISSSHSQRNIVETLLEFMTSGRVDGIILMAPQMHREVLELINKSKRPIILLNACKELKNVVSFNINNFQGAFSVTSHLIDHGYKKIGMILGPNGNCDADERYRGFLEAIKRKDLPVMENLLIPGDFNIKSGFYGLNRLMTGSDKPDAVFAANDMMAVGAYEAARLLNVRIPDDVALAGFDDIFLSRFLNPRLTTIHVPIQELGSKAVRYLLKMICGDIDPHLPFREEIATGLLIGGSCGCKNIVMSNIF